MKGDFGSKQALAAEPRAHVSHYSISALHVGLDLQYCSNRTDEEPMWGTHTHTHRENAIDIHGHGYLVLLPRGPVLSAALF